MSLFSADNKLIQFIDKYVDFMLLQLLTAVCCLPIFTIGPAYTAKYYTSMKLARGEAPNVLKSFMKAVKENFRQGILLELPAVPAILILIVDWYLTGSTYLGAFTYVLVSVMIVVTFVVYMVYAFAFPLLARYNAGTGRILKSALTVGMGTLWVSVIFMLCTAVLVWACLEWIVYGVFVWLIGGAGLCWIRSLLLVKVMDDIEKKEN